MKTFMILSIVSLLISTLLFPQSDFSIEEYKSFLSTHQNMTTQDLLQMHPAGVFRGNINTDYNSAQYFGRIDSFYNLTPYEKELIAKNGFMVSERLKTYCYGQPLLDIYNNDLPVYISTDAVLHALHQSYDRILKDVEVEYLAGSVGNILNSMRQNLPQLVQKYSGDTSMMQKLKDVDLYLSVAVRLLLGSAAPYFSSNASEVDYFTTKAINAQGMASEYIFSAKCRKVDWSQFVVRGHYIDDYHPELANYFRCMMWLGRIEIYLAAPQNTLECLPDFEDVQRQAVMAFLLNELYVSAGVDQAYQEAENVLSFFVGEPDNVTFSNLVYLKQALQITNASELLDDQKMEIFIDSLKNQSFAYQKILSQVLTSDPFSPDSIIPASAFMFFGQRFVIDSYVMASVVYDRIKFNGTKICRLYPSVLDPMFALGNDAAAQLLVSNLDNFHYSSNLASLRYLIDSYNQDFWQSTIYNSWLYGIKCLNPKTDRSGLPAFMQTAAFWQKQLNTQLTSWTQLRHDNLLYAKQSYTGGTVCFYPYTYIEPFPEFYAAIKNLGETAKQKFGSLNFPHGGKYAIMEYFEELRTICDTLEVIAVKELSGIQFTAEEDIFLHNVIYTKYEGSGDPPYKGWYPRLLYGDPGGQDALLKEDFIVADVHTVTTDCNGNPLGAVVHAGTGMINLGVFIAPVQGNTNVAFIGPVSTYLSYSTLNYKRLSDQEWKSGYMMQGLRPSFVNLYLADSSGNSRGEGLTLVTGVSDYNDIVPLDYQFVKNYPNPFNPQTTIAFNVPVGQSFKQTEVLIFNIQGELIKTLFTGELPEGNYLLKWNGIDDKNIDVSSGVYICRVTTGSTFKSLKMTLLR